LEWIPAGPEHDKLAWHAPCGVTMLLAHVYGQENGTFAAVVVAGVKDDIHQAMGAAEWAIARLSSGEGEGSAFAAPDRLPAPDRGVVSVTRRRSRTGLGWRRYLFMAGPQTGLSEQKNLCV
jgi:hypothetical protein